MDYIRALGTLALASRLRNFTDQLMSGVTRIYKESNVDFEPRWFAVTHFLSTHGPSPLTTVSNALSLSHPAVVQVINVLEKKGLVTRIKNSTDSRVTMVSLSKKGEKLVLQLMPIWEDIQAAADELLITNAPVFIESLQSLEDSLDDLGIYERIKRHIITRHKTSMNIVDFNPDYLEDFQHMNSQWIEEYIGMSDYDRLLLQEPLCRNYH